MGAGRLGVVMNLNSFVCELAASCFDTQTVASLERIDSYLIFD